jgi:hypothetical protein
MMNSSWMNPMSGSPSASNMMPNMGMMNPGMMNSGMMNPMNNPMLAMMWGQMAAMGGLPPMNSWQDADEEDDGPEPQDPDDGDQDEEEIGGIFLNEEDDGAMPTRRTLIKY